jgi:hypothetical protein
MTLQERKKFPPELLKVIRSTGENGILAGCTAEEIIELCKATVRQWVREHPDKLI